jgi:hypothetical protein
MNPQVVVPPRDDSDIVYLPVATAMAIAVQGALVSFESSVAVLFNAATEDATFAGFAMTVHAADEANPKEVAVGLKGQVIYDCTSAAYDLGDGLKYASANNLVADGGANTIAYAARVEASAVTRLRTLVDVVSLGKLFASAA